MYRASASPAACAAARSVTSLWARAVGAFMGDARAAAARSHGGGSLEEALYREEFPRVLPKGDEDGHFRLSDLGVGQPQRKERLAVSGACAILQSDEVWIFGCDLPHFTAGTMWGEGFIFFKQKKCSNKLCLPLQFYLLYLSTVWYTLGSGR
jgi:hypothetical protein